MTVLILLVGLAAGVLSGLFGIGGGVLIVGALVLVVKMPITQATGTSLGALLLPVGLLGALEYYRTGNLDIRVSLLLAVGLLLGAWVGARMATGMNPALLQRLFAAFLAVMSVRLWLSAGGS